jgi:hypothetical protein
VFNKNLALMNPLCAANSKKSGQTRRPEKRWILEIDGDRCSVWDEKCMEGLEEGIPAEYEWRQSSSFKKITDTKRLDMGAIEGKGLRIIRMSCLKTASEILSSNRV